MDRQHESPPPADGFLPWQKPTLVDKATASSIQASAAKRNPRPAQNQAGTRQQQPLQSIPQGRESHFYSAGAGSSAGPATGSATGPTRHSTDETLALAQAQAPGRDSLFYEDAQTLYRSVFSELAGSIDAGGGAAPPGSAMPAPVPPQPVFHSDEPIQVDDSDIDSTYESDAMSDTTSLRSIARRHIYENGRRYHSRALGMYWGPNDERAQENLDLYHHVFQLSCRGSLYLAPIGPRPQNVLDLGTGTGIWALDFADKHPSARVIATDLSPIQPQSVPPNLEFQVDDFTMPWTFQPGSFDFIHARSIYGCVDNYETFYAQALATLRPGGWFEQAEISVVAVCDDGSLTGTYMEQWGPLAIKGGELFGKSFSIAEDSYTLMKRAGFTNITRRIFKWPIGRWPKDPLLKEIGAFNLVGWEEGIDGWAMMLFTKYLGWKPEEVQVLIGHIRNELRDPSIHAYQYVTVCYGQRPR